METWILLSLKYSLSVVSSITTTFPSQGEMINCSPVVKVLLGMRKNQKTQNHSSPKINRIGYARNGGTKERQSQHTTAYKMVETKQYIWPSLWMVMFINLSAKIGFKRDCFG